MKTKFSKHTNITYPLKPPIGTAGYSYLNFLSEGVDTLAHTQASSSTLSDALGLLAWPSDDVVEEQGSPIHLVSYFPVLHRGLGYPEGISHGARHFHAGNELQSVSGRSVLLHSLILYT